MKKGIYLVGGCVRDLLLNIEPKDYDYVVVGYTVREFLEQFPSATQIGKSFPVFQIHQKAGTPPEEYAFARKERKVGTGHNGFEVIADPTVTLEEDLARRDLTINAMAMDEDGVVIDPFGGEKDLFNRTLRHVSPAFAEDPLRVFRLARFAAIFGFQVDSSTAQLAREMAPELPTLSAERVCEETRKVMKKAHAPEVYFDVLRQIGALDHWFSELAALIGVPAGPPEHHAEEDAFAHTMLALRQVESSDKTEILRWAVLLHDLGKGITPKEEWPAHHGHDKTGVPLVEAFCDRLRLPKAIKQACVLACREHMRVHVIREMKATKWVDLVQAAEKTLLGADGLAEVCRADACGRCCEGKPDTLGAETLLLVKEPILKETGHPIPEVLTGHYIGLHVRARKASAAKRFLKNGC